MTITGNPEALVEEMFDHVRSENTEGLFASRGPLFHGAVFGRDSAVAGRHLVEFDPNTPRYHVLQVLSKFQGLISDPISEEEPGRIHHERRHIRDARDEESLEIFHKLSEMWGGNDEEMVYYGSVDATALFLCLSLDYVRNYGMDILGDEIIGRDGQPRTFAEHMLMANDWIKGRIDNSEIGMVEYKRSNPMGILNPVWEDSETSYMHEDGSLANYDFPIAPVEVQGFSYDALKGMDALFPGSVPEGYVEKYGRNIIDRFWLPDKQMFAKALDRDPSGKPRPITVPSSNVGLLLDSNLLLDFPEGKHMADTTVRMLMGPDFLTPAGIRCRSLAFADLVDFPDYHGSYAVWAHQTASIMKGMLRHGYKSEARELAQSIVDNMSHFDKDYPYPEFNFVDKENNVIHPEQQTGIFADKRCNKPEPHQTWSMSAFLYSIYVLNTLHQEAA